MSKEKKVDNVNKKVQEQKKKTKKNEDKKSLWVRFRIFCHGVRSEFSKIHWTSKKDLIKYSIASICFLIFASVFFYLIDVLFALIQSLF